MKPRRNRDTEMELFEYLLQTTAPSIEASDETSQTTAPTENSSMGQIALHLDFKRLTTELVQVLHEGGEDPIHPCVFSPCWELYSEARALADPDCSVEIFYVIGGGLAVSVQNEARTRKLKFRIIPDAPSDVQITKTTLDGSSTSTLPGLYLNIEQEMAWLTERAHSMVIETYR